MVPGRARASAGAGESSSGQTTRSAQGVHLCICVTGAAAADPPADAADPPADADLLLCAIRQQYRFFDFIKSLIVGISRTIFDKYQRIA